MTHDHPKSSLPDLAFPDPVDYGEPAIRVMMMPKDTNALGTIFGGLILSYIDQAGAVEAHRCTNGRLLTVAVHEVDFVAPVFVGDLVSFYAKTLRRGRTSVSVHVLVTAERRLRGGDKVIVTQAEVVYVQVDDDGHPTPLPANAPDGSPCSDDDSESSSNPDETDSKLR